MQLKNGIDHPHPFPVVVKTFLKEVIDDLWVGCIKVQDYVSANPYLTNQS